MKRSFRNNCLLGINTDRGRIENMQGVKKEVKIYFKSRFQETNYRKPKLIGVSFRSLPYDERHNLEALFLYEEIKEVIWSSDCDKSRGPDGYNIWFFNKCWDVLKDDIYRVVNEFHVNPKLPNEFHVNDTFFLNETPCDQFFLVSIRRHFFDSQVWLSWKSTYSWLTWLPQVSWSVTKCGFMKRLHLIICGL